jgi:hypothetical protein
MASRIEQARRRSDRAKRILTVTAVAGFAAAPVAARVTHPGHAAAAPTPTKITEQDDFFGSSTTSRLPPPRPASLAN